MRFSPVRASLVAAAVLLLGVPALIAQQAPEGEAAAATQRAPDEIYSDLRLFGEVFDRIRSDYVDPPDERKLIHAAIQGMLSSLDPHSGYLEPEGFADMQEDTSGKFGGLGIEVTMEEGLVKVVSPIDDTPAAKAGIMGNDLIVEIDGQQVMGLTLDQAVERMRGPIGSPITVMVMREGASEPIKFEMKRDIIAMRAVRWSMEGDVAIMRLARFSEQAYPGIQKAVDDIWKQRDGLPPKGIVLDLRNNPGGLVDQSVRVADAFLDKGAVVLTRGRTASEDHRYDARPDPLDERIKQVPLVVLINGASASASEIVAGALQDHKRATLVGTRSFGKGSVQSITSLGDDGAMRMTTARYYTPNNRSIQASGIHPDIEVLQKVPEELQGRDTILGEAGLQGQIGGGSEDAATIGSSVYVPADQTEDTQLQFAIRLINGEETNPAFPPKPDA